MARSVRVNAMHVPAVLEFRELVSRVERTPQGRKVDAERDVGLTEPILAAVCVVFTRILETNAERHRPRKQDAARERRDAIHIRALAGDVLNVAAGQQRVPEIRETLSAARPPAVLSDTAERNPVANDGLGRELQTRKSRTTFDPRTFESDRRVPRHLGGEDLIAQAERTDRSVVG